MGRGRGMRILGVDAGTQKIGLAVVENGKLIDSREVNLGAGVMQKRLKRLREAVDAIVKAHNPQAIALEDGFSGGYATATKATAMARAVVLLVAEDYRLQVTTYLPTDIKKQVAGKGNATKDDMRQAVKVITGRACTDKEEDEADAIAIAYTHWARSRAVV
jgi:crossover junction endodeoxyribonuclease RuvC